MRHSLFNTAVNEYNTGIGHGWNDSDMAKNVTESVLSQLIFLVHVLVIWESVSQLQVIWQLRILCIKPDAKRSWERKVDIHKVQTVS